MLLSLAIQTPEVPVRVPVALLEGGVQLWVGPLAKSKRMATARCN